MKAIRKKKKMKLIKMISSLFTGRGTGSTLDQSLNNIDWSNATLIDVRTEKEFAGGSVDGATNIPLSQIRNRQAELIDKKEIVLFCRSGNRSAKALSILRAIGISNGIDGGTWHKVKKLKEEK